jgi:hypothetical protein
MTAAPLAARRIFRLSHKVREVETNVGVTGWSANVVVLVMGDGDEERRIVYCWVHGSVFPDAGLGRG